MKTAFRVLGPYVMFIGLFQLYLAKPPDTIELTLGIIYIATGAVILVLSALTKNDRQSRF